MLGHAYSNGEWAEVYRILPSGERVRWHDYDDAAPDCGLKPAGQPGSGINHTPAEDIDWDNIPPRPWMAGTRLLRGYVTLLTGPGGVGKTALTMTSALSYALGRNLLDPSNTNRHWRLHGGRKRTYLYSLEDDLNETARRMRAVMNFHGVQPEETKDFLAFGDGSVDRLILAISEAGRKLVRTALVDALIEHLLQRRVDILIIDPLVKVHTCNENDNGEMDFVMILLKEVAAKAGCALWVVHHSGKAGTATDPHGGRGASSIPAAGRVNETLAAATQDDKNRYGFGRDMVRLDVTKANMSPIGEDDTQWLRLRGCAVGNGDYAQVIELVDPQDQTERMDEMLFDAICDALSAVPDSGSGSWVAKASADNWIGRAFRAGGIGADGRAKALVSEWQKLGLLIPDIDAKDDRKRPVKTAIRLNQVMAAKYRSQRWGG